MDTSKMVKVAFRGPEDILETLWATPMEPGLFRVENSPFFFYGLSYLDVVHADQTGGGQYEFVKIVEKSGHRTLGVMMDDTRSPEGVTLMEEIAKLGGSYEGFPPALLTIDLPPTIEFDSIVGLLRQRGVRWEYADPRKSTLFPKP